MASRNWCFTLNANEADGEHIKWTTAGADCPVRAWLDCDQIQYLVCQVERVAHVHVQGYIQFTCVKRLAGLKKISPSAHWEFRRGTHAEAKAYCMKPESRVLGPWELGEEKDSQGKRNDLEAIGALVKAKKTNFEIVEELGASASKFAKHIAFLRFVDMETSSDRQLQGVKVTTLYGATGTGKTYAAINFIAGSKDYYICEAPSHKDSKVWFDGYEGQHTLIIDDFDGSFCSFRYMLRLLDKYKLKVEIKGGFSWAVWTTVVITSNIHPSGWYSSVDTAPLQRRLTEGGSEIRLITEQGCYKRVDWTEHVLDEDDQQFLPSRASSPAAAVDPLADTTTAANEEPAVPAATTTTGRLDPDIPDTQPFEIDAWRADIAAYNRAFDAYESACAIASETGVVPPSPPTLPQSYYVQQGHAKDFPNKPNW